MMTIHLQIRSAIPDIHAVIDRAVAANDKRGVETIRSKHANPVKNAPAKDLPVAKATVVDPSKTQTSSTELTPPVAAVGYACASPSLEDLQNINGMWRADKSKGGVMAAVNTSLHLQA